MEVRPDHHRWSHQLRKEVLESAKACSMESSADEKKWFLELADALRFINSEREKARSKPW